MNNRRPPGGNRRMDFPRNDRGPKNFGRSGVSPWQGGGPGGGMPNLLPLSGGSTEATLALASNIINLLQPRPNPVPSLLDMPIRRDFGPNMGRYDRGYGPNRMGNQGNFRRTGNYNRAGERINTNRKPFRPHDGQRQHNKSSPKKEADSKANNAKESEEEKPEGEVEAAKPEEKKENPKTRYDDINPQLLKCHICNKSMWDGRSFENHLSGRAHAIMMQKTAESYALTADTMRQEFKIREMKRTRKTGQQPPRDFYCAMCDLYAADGAIHRTTVGHRKLKKYLHPTCTSCHKEMPTRIELDEHRLTAEHLRNMQDKSDVISKPKPEVMLISTLNMEQMYLRDDRQRWRVERDRKRAAAKMATDDKSNPEQVEDGENKNESAEAAEAAEDKPETAEDIKHPLDREDTVLDYKEGDDLSHFTYEMLPVYSISRGVGRSFLSEFKCIQCTLCRKLLDGEETAEVHLRTWRHHQFFNRLLCDKSGTVQSNDNGKRSHQNEDDGNWKRRKMNRDGDEETPADHNGHTDNDDKEESSKDIDDHEDLKESEDMPAEDDLEDWEQSVDEILQDEQDNKIEEDNESVEDVTIKQEIVELEDDEMKSPKKAPVQTPVAPVAQAPATPTPAAPTPATSTPATRTPAAATPTTQTPATATPTIPTPATPTPATPTPAATTPATPSTATPTPVTPKPTTSTAATPKTPTLTPALPKPMSSPMPRGRGRGRRRY